MKPLTNTKIALVTLFIVAILSVNNIVAQNNTWDRKADFPGSVRFGGIAASVDLDGDGIPDKGYIGAGRFDCANTYTDFWEYDPLSDSWTQKATFLGIERTSTVSFSLDGLLYTGTGDPTCGGTSKDFWEYSPSNNQWTQKTDFPGTARWGAVGFSIDSFGYIGTGTDGSHKVDFWRYDPSDDSWTSIADLPGNARRSAVGFAIDLDGDGISDKGYVGTGWNGSTRYVDFWEYDPNGNSWTQKADFGGVARVAATGFSMMSKGYLGLGNDNLSNRLNDFWEYDPIADNWTQKTNFGGAQRQSARGFSIQCKGYIGIGADAIISYNDFWEYTSTEGNPIADFEYLSNEKQIELFDSSTNDPTSWLWDFDDGNLSTLQNPIHIYLDTGTYNICLIATNGCGSDTLCKDVSVCASPLTDFEYTSSFMIFTFFDSSEFADSWLWDFGDGNLSTLQNPIHTYIDTGVYTVCLTAMNSCGSDSMCELVSVFETSVPEAYKRNELEVYPNPVYDNLIVDLSQNTGDDIEVVVYNILGKPIYKVPRKTVSKHKFIIPLSDHPAGIYYIKTKRSNVLLTKKVVLIN